MPAKRIIVGLGNPGEEYENTRHNAGAMALVYAARSFGLPEFKFDKYSNALTTKDEENVFVIPQTFMNLSGKTVSFLMNKEIIPVDKILVLHDDKDIALGESPLQKDRSSAGHKGVQSIIDLIGTQNFSRIRIGIGPVPGKIETDAFVLQKFSEEELSILTQKVFPEVAQKIKVFISNS